MLVHRMVKKVKDSKVWAKINMKDESDRLESLKRQLAQAKQTGGDKDYEKELEDEIKELEAQYQREGLTKDADPRGYKVSDQIIKGFLIYKSGKGPATYFAKNENGKEFEGTMEQIKKQIDDYWVKQDEDVMKQKVRDEDYKGYEITEEEKGFVVRKGSEVKVIVGSVQKAKEYVDRFVTKDALTRATYMREKDQLMMKIKDARNEGRYHDQNHWEEELQALEDEWADTKTKDDNFEESKHKRDESGKFSSSGGGGGTAKTVGKEKGKEKSKKVREPRKYTAAVLAEVRKTILDPKERAIRHPANTPKQVILRDEAINFGSELLAQALGIPGKIPEEANTENFRFSGGKKGLAARKFAEWAAKHVDIPDNKKHLAEYAKIYKRPFGTKYERIYRKTKDSKSLSEYKQEHAQLLDALKAEKAKGSPDKAEISGIEKNIAAVVGMISAMMTKDKSIHPRFRIKDDKLFRLRDCLRKLKGRDTYTKGSADRKMKDVELNNRVVWRKEDFDKMVSAGNFTIVSKQPWGYEVKVKSGNIYGVEIKDTYTKGSADRKTKDDYKSMSLEELQDKAKQGYFELQSDPKLRNHVEIKYPNGKREWIFVEKLAKDKYTGDPLTAKGRKIMAAMREKYGAKKGKQVFFASRNKGTIKNVDPESMDSKTKDDLFETIRKIRNSSGAIVGTIAIYDASGEFVVETWNLKSGKDVKKVVKRFPYEGNEDRKAALAMARGFVNTYPDYEFKDSKTKDNEPNQSDIEAAQRGNNMVGMSLVDLDDLIRLMEGKSDFAARVTVAAAKQMIAAKKRMGAKDSTRKVIHHLIKTKQRKVI